jgi:hypothetical protein
VTRKKDIRPFRAPTQRSKKNYWGGPSSRRALKNALSSGCSKTFRCKAFEILRSESYSGRYVAATKDEKNAADERFSTAC